jgi:hypothetical protein
MSPVDGAALLNAWRTVSDVSSERGSDWTAAWEQRAKSAWRAGAWLGRERSGIRGEREKRLLGIREHEGVLKMSGWACDAHR